MQARSLASRRESVEGNFDATMRDGEAFPMTQEHRIRLANAKKALVGYMADKKPKHQGPR